MGTAVNLTDGNFKAEVLDSPVPVLVDFWAEWCVPCKMLGPLLDQLGEDYRDKIKVAKLNVDEQGEIASRFNIISIPTILLFHKGEVAKQQVGAVPRKVLEEMIKGFV
jgi:thioredoxin 1